LVFLENKPLESSTIAFEFKTAIPEGVPPTFKGTSCKCFYIASISLQIQGNKEVVYLHTPFAVCSEGDIQISENFPYKCSIEV
ncbi:unnamed protein product, partial [Heterosigma akashiwo]